MEKDLIIAFQNLLSQFQASQKQEEKLLNSVEAAKVLDVSLSTLYKYNMRKEIPSYKALGSNRLFYKIEDLHSFMTQTRRASKHEISERARNIIDKK